MKKLVTAILIGSLSIAGSGITQGNELVDYLGGGIAIQDVDGFDNGFALALNAGKNMANVNENFFLEGEFTYTLSSPEKNSAELDILTLGGYGVFILPLNEQFNLKGRGGLLYWDADSNFGFRGDDSDIELSAGFGAEYALDDTMKITLDYTIIESHINHLGLGIKVGI